MLKLRDLLDYSKALSVTALMLGLAGCGGGGSEDILCGGDCGLQDDIDTPTGTTGSSGISVGNGTGANFAPGVLATDLGFDDLSPGGRLTLTGTVVDENGALVTDTVLVSISSGCIEGGLAVVDRERFEISTGEFTVEYTAQGCEGAESVVATVNDATATANFIVDGVVYSLGNGSGSSFEPGVLAPGIGESTLSAGGTTSIAISIASQDGVLAGSNILGGSQTFVTVSSPCSIVGLAEISENINLRTGGTTFEYTANGCVGEDLVTATTEIIHPATGAPVQLTATTTIDVAPDTVTSIVFVSAEPEQLSIAGTGGVETSLLTFQVLGDLGGPVSGQNVTFTLTTQTGGISLPGGGATDTDISDNNGIITTNVTAGTVNTPVRVVAAVDGTGVVTQSNQLVISTGITDADSFSISLDTFNPEGLDYDGETVEVTARLADVFNNPAPDGTVVSFYTEGGAIEPNCLTVDGACSVDWVSQDPRPGNGRVEILAYTTGAESITVDANSNGVFDSGDSFGDLDSAFADNNENGVYDVGEFVPDGTFAVGNGQYNGPLCTANCATESTLTIGESVTMVMSGSVATLIATGGLGAEGSTVNVGASNNFTGVVIGDVNGNSMPAGTTINISVSNGSLASDSTHTIRSRTTPFQLPAIVIDSDGTASSSVNGLKITVTTPRGDITEFFWNLSDS